MRLRQSLSFWVCVVLQVSFAATVFFMMYSVYPEETHILGKSFIISPYIMFFLSIFITSFICTDYSCQTIRNKLFVGHSLEAIYFSNFITTWIGSVIITAAFWITLLVISVFVGFEAGMPLNEFCFLIVTKIAAVTALVSLYVLLSELITSKSKAVTTALILSLILLIMYPIIGDMHIEFNVQAANVISKGVSVFFTDVMPSGQIDQMMQMETAADIKRIFPIYSLVVTVVSSAIGVLIFRRKDLK